MALNNETKLFRPKAELMYLLQNAGATKDVFTLKEVLVYLGEYIMQKQLYDQNQQHIVHCAQDALGRVLGLDRFSVKEPKVLFTGLTKNLLAVNNQEPTISSIEGHGPQVDRGTQAAEPQTSPPDRSSSTSNDPDPQSCCVIDGLGSGQDRTSSESDVDSLPEWSVVDVPSDVDSDNFSTEFELPSSTDSDDYEEDDSSMSPDDQVYEVTVSEDDEDDAELTDAEETPGSEVEDNDGVDVPDGQRDKTPPASQEKLLSSDSQPSTSTFHSSSLDSQENLCLICQSRPKNGCIVHGKTAHLMSCYVCARKLKRRNKMCPVCRMPIQQVVATYFN